jgi:protein-S-isoprenylcysteine O-methyltransferase Ste14
MSCQGDNMPDRTKSRVVGVVAVVIGLAAVAWIWHTAHATGHFPGKLSILGPVFVSLGIWLTVEGPELPANRLSPLGWVFLVLGLIAGVLFQELLKTGRLPFLD